MVFNSITFVVDGAHSDAHVSVMHTHTHTQTSTSTSHNQTAAPQSRSSLFLARYDLVFYELIDFGVAQRRVCLQLAACCQFARLTTVICVCMCVRVCVGSLTHRLAASCSDNVATIILIIIFVTFVFAGTLAGAAQCASVFRCLATRRRLLVVGVVVRVWASASAATLLRDKREHCRGGGCGGLIRWSPRRRSGLNVCVRVGSDLEAATGLFNR